MCGEMVGDFEVVLLLLGLGLGEFFVGVGSILRIRKIINLFLFKEM